LSGRLRTPLIESVFCVPLKTVTRVRDVSQRAPACLRTRHCSLWVSSQVSSVPLRRPSLVKAAVRVPLMSGYVGGECVVATMLPSLKPPSRPRPSVVRLGDNERQLPRRRSVGQLSAGGTGGPRRRGRVTFRRPSVSSSHEPRAVVPRVHPAELVQQREHDRAPPGILGTKARDSLSIAKARRGSSKDTGMRYTRTNPLSLHQPTPACA
jgi:hypothetical protein